MWQASKMASRMGIITCLNRMCLNTLCMFIRQSILSHATFCSSYYLSRGFDAFLFLCRQYRLRGNINNARYTDEISYGATRRACISRGFRFGKWQNSRRITNNVFGLRCSLDTLCSWKFIFINYNQTDIILYFLTKQPLYSAMYTSK